MKYLLASFILFFILILPVNAQQTISVDISKMMTNDEFKKAGLNKLSDEELKNLNLFLNKFTERVIDYAYDNFKKNNPTSDLDSANSIESRIDGDFEGWTGDTIFKLINGQIWQQTSYSYKYRYSYSPKVTIFKSGSVYKMAIEGMDGVIEVKRLK